MIAPMAAYLAHERCSYNGAVFSAIGGNFSTIRVVDSKGCFSPQPSPEWIDDNVADVLDAGDLSATRLLAPENAIERCAELIYAYTPG